MAKSIGKLSKLIFEVTESGIISPKYPLPIYQPIQPIFFPPIKPIYQKSRNIIYSQKRSYSDRKLKIRQK
jgi:hypothetical protein